MNTFKTTVLLAALTGLLMAVGAFFGGTNGMTIMFVIALVMNFVSYWYSDKIVLNMYGAREVQAQQAPELVRLVAGLAQKARLPMPRVYIMNTDVPNAFATGRDPAHAAVAVTTGIMRALDSEELEGVLAHELSHVKNRDTLISTIVATIAGVITMIANIAQWTALLGFGRDDNDNGIGGLISFVFLVILAPLAATLIQLGVSRTREYQADHDGALTSGKPLALARALEKIEYYARHRALPEATPATAHMFIVNPFSGRGDWALSLFSTHPATAQRVAKLKELAAKVG